MFQSSYSSPKAASEMTYIVSDGEREFIFHIATTLEQAHSRNTKLGGLPERHLAHQSWPPNWGRLGPTFGNLRKTKEKRN